MAGDTIITVVGNLTADPDLRYTQNGAAVANFTVASTPRMFNRNTNDWQDGETLFLRCNAWRGLAENVTETLQKGTRTIVQGRLKSRSFETKEGEKRTVFELDVDEVGPSLRYATAHVAKQEFSGGSGQQQPQQGGWQQIPPSDPWASSQRPMGGADNEPPF